MVLRIQINTSCANICRSTVSCLDNVQCMCKLFTYRQYLTAAQKQLGRLFAYVLFPNLAFSNE